MSDNFFRVVVAVAVDNCVALIAHFVNANFVFDEISFSLVEVSCGCELDEAGEDGKEVHLVEIFFLTVVFS